MEFVEKGVDLEALLKQQEKKKPTSQKISKGELDILFSSWNDDVPDKEAYMKKTCLWGKFNVPEKNPVELKYKPNANGQNTWNNLVGGKSLKTKRFRSKTPERFAKAFVKANNPYPASYISGSAA